MKDIIVFSNEWFEKYQDKLLRFANTAYGRYVLRIHGDRSDVGKNRITKIEPHAITWRDGDNYKTEFRTHAKFSKRLYYAYKPLWYLFHAWDMLVANKLNVALNIGFDTLTVYPEAGSGSTTTDGYVQRSPGTQEAFSTIRSGAGTTVSSSATSGEYTYLASPGPGGWYMLRRSVFTINTSSLGANSIISAATMSFYGTGKNLPSQYGFSSTQSNLRLVTSSPTVDNALVAGDYSVSKFGSTSLGTAITYSSFSTAGYNSFTLDSTGLNNISKTGVTKYGLRFGADIDNNGGSSPSDYGGLPGFYFAGKYADSSGTSGDPKLTVTYSVGIEATYSNSNPYANGKLMSKTTSGSWTNVTSGDLYFTTYTSDGATTVPFLSQDPSDILRAVIDNYNDNGGTVTYDVSSIDDTGTTVSYTFNTQTTLECINKVLELAPTGWYWYVDPATNLLHFHAKASSADHKLTLGKDISRLAVQKRIEGVINTIYFTGGGTPVLYEKYQDSTSVGLYGIKAIRYIDERVTLSATASKIANRIIAANGAPEVRLTVDVIDSNASNQGYDLESIEVGDVLNIGNVTGNTGSSLWDVAQWDVDKFDYNISQIGSMYLQIVRKEVFVDKSSLVCSSIPPDISKRIEDINRNLEITQSANNPDAPA